MRSTVEHSASSLRRVVAVVVVALAAAVVVSLGAAPVQAVQNFDNAAIADAGLSEVGTSRPTGWNQPGECIKSVQRWVAKAGGHFGNGGVISGYVNSGAKPVSLASAVKGDVIQYTAKSNGDNNWSRVHTVVVVKNYRNGRFDIVQSNAPAGSGRVTRDTNWAPNPPAGWEARVWRFGKVTSPPPPKPKPPPPPPPPPKRIGVINENGNLHVKEGDINQPWTLVMEDVRDFRLEGDRIAVLKTNGQLYAKEGNLSAQWDLISSGGVVEFEITDNWLGILDNNGELRMKEGPLNAGWTLVSTGVKEFELSPRRVAVLNTRNELHVKVDLSMHSGYCSLLASPGWM